MKTDADTSTGTASASQSSTPVPRVGGPDEAKSGPFADFMAEAAKAGITKLDFTDLAHVARQRQESANCVACEGNPTGSNNPCAICGKSSAAVAAGVDTSKMAEKLAELVTAYISMPDSDTEGQAWWNLVNFVAQQREAGRREKQAEIDRLMLEFCPDEMTPEQKAKWARSQQPAATLARQPVSEGPTDVAPAQQP